MMKLEGDDMVESKTEALKNIARVGRAMSVYMPNSLENDLTVFFYSFSVLIRIDQCICYLRSYCTIYRPSKQIHNECKTQFNGVRRHKER